jgi:hypothetical protein
MTCVPVSPCPVRRGPRRPMWQWVAVWLAEGRSDAAGRKSAEGGPGSCRAVSRANHPRRMTTNFAPAATIGWQEGTNTVGQVAQSAEACVFCKRRRGTNCYEDHGDRPNLLGTSAC